MRKLKMILALTLLAILGACSSENTNEGSNESTELIINATQFSRINSSQLVEIMGKPEKIEDYKWSVPKTGQSIVGKLYIYEKNKYEFILFDDSVVRLKVYSGQYWGYDESTMTFEKKEDIFPLFGIKPNEYLKKVADTNSALRFSPVSDKVAELWIQDINNNEFGAAVITYNLNYF